MTPTPPQQTELLPCPFCGRKGSKHDAESARSTWQAICRPAVPTPTIHTMEAHGER